MISYRDTRLLAPLPVSKIPNFEGGGGGGGGGETRCGNKRFGDRERGGGRKGGKPGGREYKTICVPIMYDVKHVDLSTLESPITIPPEFGSRS